MVQKYFLHGGSTEKGSNKGDVVVGSMFGPLCKQIAAMLLKMEKLRFCRDCAFSVHHHISIEFSSVPKQTKTSKNSKIFNSAIKSRRNWSKSLPCDICLCRADENGKHSTEEDG